MKIYRATFVITLIGGIFILFMGIYLQITGRYSDVSIKKSGIVFRGMVNGPSEIFLGMVVLALSFWAFKLYKKKKEELRRMR